MRWIIPLAAALIGAVIGFQFTLGALPGMIMGRVMETFGTLGGIPNQEGHAPPIDETARTVVRPSPDILYSGCIYDVTDGPMRVTMPAPRDDGYASVSFFDRNTNNFAVINDRQIEGRDITVTLTGPQYEGVVSGEVILQAPTETGLVLMRRIMMDPDDYERLDRERQAFRCEAMR